MAQRPQRLTAVGRPLPIAGLPDHARGVLVPVDWLAGQLAPVDVPLDGLELRLELGPIVEGFHDDMAPLAALRVNR